MTDRLPVIDLGPLRSGHGAELERVTRAIHQACTTVGFFYVTNHGIREGLLTQIVATARAFFARPEAEKRAVAARGPETNWRGWSALGTEVTKGKRDWHECIDFMTERRDDAPASAFRSPLHGKNLWPDLGPDSLAGFRTSVESYFGAMTGLGTTLLEGLSLSSGFERDFFAKQFTTPFCILRLLHYPPQPVSDADAEIGAGIGEHTDYGCLTLLTATEPGLSVRTPDGRWIDAPPISGTFVCNLGDALETWTYGVYKATPHRVVASSERVSIPFFFDPNLDAVVRPIESLRRPGMPVADAFRYGPYLLAAYERSYPQGGELPTPEPGR
jgi:isopenicillin N synthase-like dioxygenase